MATYTVRVWNNGNDDERGSEGEYDMSTSLSEIGKGDEIYTADEIRMRLLEALNINLAGIAETLERMRRDRL